MILKYMVSVFWAYEFRTTFGNKHHIMLKILAPATASKIICDFITFLWRYTLQYELVTGNCLIKLYLLNWNMGKFEILHSPPKKCKAAKIDKEMKVFFV